MFSGHSFERILIVNICVFRSRETKRIGKDESLRSLYISLTFVFVAILGVLDRGGAVIVRIALLGVDSS